MRRALAVRIIRVCLALGVSSTTLAAQRRGEDVQPRMPRVPLDRESAAIGAVLPFDEPFVLVDDAPATLLTLELWYGESRGFAIDSCASLSPEKRERLTHSRWTRGSAQTDSLWLPVDSLRPNHSYTFCFQSISTPSRTDSLAFQQLAQEALRATIRQRIADRGGQRIDSTYLRALQRALRGALPKADSVIVPAASIFDLDAPIAAVTTGFLTLANADDTRRTVAETFDSLRQADTLTHPEALGSLLVRLGADTALWQLPRLTINSLSTIKEERSRYAAAAAIARTLRRITPVEAAAVAGGQSPLDNPAIPTGNLNITERWSLAEVGVLARNLDSTMAQLDALRDLINAAEDHPPLARVRGLGAADLERLRATLESVRIAAAFQRSGARQLSAALTALDAAVVTLVRAVATRELGRVGLHSSTAADYEARARWYVGQDLGIAYVWKGDVAEMSPTLGLNFYFRPVNKRAPLGSWSDPAAVLRRLSLTLAVTTSDIEDSDRYDGVVKGKAFVIGAGVRISDFFRVSYGAPLVYENPDSESGRRRVTALQSISLSIDADLREVVSSVVNAIF